MIKIKAKDQRKEHSRQKEQLGKCPEETICWEYLKAQMDGPKSVGSWRNQSNSLG